MRSAAVKLYLFLIAILVVFICVAAITEPAHAYSPVIWGSPFPKNLGAGMQITKSDSGAGCDATTLGTIRLNSTDLEFCDGSAWAVLSGGGGGITWSTPIDANITFDSDEAWSIGDNTNQAATIHTLELQGHDSGGLGVNATVGEVYLNSATDTVSLYASTNPISMKFWDTANAFSTSVKAPETLAADTTFVLPPDDGLAGNLLRVDGSGVTTWAPEIAITGGNINFTDRGFLGTNTENQTTWGSDLPGLVIDGTASEVISGGGLFLQGSSSQYLTILTSDKTGSAGSSYINMLTGAVTSGSGQSGGVVIYSGPTDSGASGNMQFSSSASTSGDSGQVVVSVGGAPGGISGNMFLTVDPGSSSANSGLIQANSRLLQVTSGAQFVSKTGDPCGDTDAFPNGTLFYNTTSSYYCFCNGAGNDVQMHSPATACF